MNLFAPMLSFIASGLLAFLLLSSHVKGRFNAQKIFFLLSVSILAFFSLVQGLLLFADSLSEARTLLRVFIVAALLSVSSGLMFYYFFARSSGGRSLKTKIPAILALMVALSISGSLTPLHHLIRSISFEENGFFYQITVTWLGKGFGILILILNVSCLYFMENTYRAANIQGKVTLKYPMLGTIIASLLNFVVMSRVLSLSSIDRRFLAIESCGMIFITVTFIFADSRYDLFEIRAPELKERPSAISVIVAGLYFISIALISWVSALSGMSYDIFNLYVLGIFTVFLLLAVGISGRARRKLRIFLNDNFYLENYNYRKEWRRFSRLMASSLTIDDFLSNTIGSLCETVMVQRGIIWVEINNGIEASYGATGDNWTPETSRQLMELCRKGELAIFKKKSNRKLDLSTDLENDRNSGDIPEWIEAAAPLGHGEGCKGFIALGRKDTGAPFNEEDSSFLATIADQAATTLDNLLMEEKFLESKQIESFNRFASFVIHDLKNTVEILSLTAENAKENMEDREFQKDTIKTIKRSIERMQSLINSLNAHQYSGDIKRARTDAVSLVRRKIDQLVPMAESKGITLEYSLAGDVIADVDPASVERVTENLIMNSLDATPEGGKISVELLSDGASGMTLRVTDTGKGFDPDYLENYLFKPFSSTKKNGLGIGLALCKSMAEAHGGRIIIDNLAGNGASVSIILPGVEQG